ncbi:GLPGLI family protein [Flavobacterium sp.]|jgi:GLPGLI family protein|uniref:GLPGLI family protein n=1 Tax=Flavobacterium sp. TaxID=239 RepID=UPI0037BF0801
MKYFILFLFPFTLFSQNIGLKVDYTYTDQNNVTIPSSLYIKGNESVFKIYDSRETGVVDTPTGDVYHVENDPLSKFCYTNNEKVYYRFVVHNRELIYYDEYQSKINWKINSEKKKKIGKYNCTEARLILNGRNYIAWFTYEMPVKFGPMKLHNLPGLIVEAIEEGGHFSIKLNKISRVADDSEIEKYKSYVLNKKVMYNYKEYEKKITEFEVNHKISWIASVKKMDIEDGSTTTVNDDLSNSNVIKKLLDIPPTLINELKKYRYN